MTSIPRLTLSTLTGLVWLTAAAAAQDRVLTLSDVSPALNSLIGNTDLDFVAKANIEYGVTGKADYDRFYRESAIAYGGFVVGQGLTNDATTNLKGYARNKAAIAELEAEIAEITEGADPDDWTTEQSIAVLQAAEAKDQLSADEREYMAATALRIAATLPVLKAAIESSAELSGIAPGLVSGARSAFGLRGATGAARNVQRSADRIADIPSSATKLVEELTVLSHGLSMVSGG
ncbi:MAG TPA: hypothetical protein VGA22_02190 [Gemmatimonadales bacterium]|jgi:hypothetical protein